MESHLVVFNLANELYGVSIAAVSEIIMLQPITYVPRAPAFVEGVTNLRGKVLPVIDLRKRFGLPREADTKDTRIVVAEINRTLVGMVVDAVSQVLRVPEGAIEPPSPVVTTVDSAFISGIAKVANQLIILLDLEKVLLPGEKADLQRVALQQGAGAALVAGVPAAPAPAATEKASSAPEAAPAAAAPPPGSARKKSRPKSAAPPAAAEKAAPVPAVAPTATEKATPVPEAAPAATAEPPSSREAAPGEPPLPAAQPRRRSTPGKKASRQKAPPPLDEPPLEY